jgi:FGGY family of carbohydrate kinases, N-terminal domain
MIWLDDRARENVAPFGERFGAERIHAISGRALDVNPCLYRLLWMQDHEPDTFNAMEIVADVHGYLVFRLTVCWAATSIASADATGTIDVVGRGWSHEILDAVGISESKALSLAAPGAWLGEVAASLGGGDGSTGGNAGFRGRRRRPMRRDRGRGAAFRLRLRQPGHGSGRRNLRQRLQPLPRVPQRDRGRGERLHT